MIEISKYKSLIFDCDGVILNSNKIKTDAFRKVLNNFDQNAVDEFIKYHQTNGGISRYIKFEYFLNNILPKYERNKVNKEILLMKFLAEYSSNCKSLLCKSEVSKNLKKLRRISGKIPWLVVSGGDQNELREVFKHKKIFSYFNGGIYGSPDKKNIIIQREIHNKTIKFPALMFGDSKLDFVVAKANDIDFLFVTQWTDFEDYESYCIENTIETIYSLSEIN